MCKLQLAVETVFLEASKQLVGQTSSGLSGRQAEALERLAFDWALNAETYVEPKFSDLGKAREKVKMFTFSTQFCKANALVPGEDFVQSSACECCRSCLWALTSQEPWQRHACLVSLHASSR